MAVPVYLQDVTYVGKQVESPGDIIKRGVFNGLDLADLGITVREDVVVREQMYLISMQESITRKRTGCGERTNSGALIARQKYLEVTNLQIWDEICAEDFGGTFWTLFRKKGYDVNNLEGTQIQEVLNELYMGIWKRDMLTIVQFADTAIAPGAVVANPGPGGTPAAKAAYAAYAKKAMLSSLDGFWKLVFAGAAKRTADAADPDGITRAEIIPQTGALPANYTRDVLLPSLYAAQSELMYQVDDSEKRFVLSRSLFQNYADSIARTPATDASFLILQNGQKEYYYKGVKLVENRMIEQKADELKRRAYLIVDGGFQVGTDTMQDSQTMETWYSKDFDLNNIRIRYKLGVQYVDGDVIVAAY